MQKRVLASSYITKENGEGFIDLPYLQLIIYFIHAVSKELRKNPQVYYIEKECSIWILYPNSCYDCESLLSEYSPVMASISKTSSVTIEGLVDNLETGELSARFVDKGIECLKKNVSGKDFDLLSSICIKATLKDQMEGEFLQDIIKDMDYDKDCIPVSRKWEDDLSISHFLETDNMTKYRCLGLEDFEDSDNKDFDFLESLSVVQITDLWCDFLDDGRTDTEFELLYDLYKEGQMVNMFVWELGLRLALSKLNIVISNEGNKFTIINQYNERLRFDFSSTSPAEKLLLKILFPV